MDLLKKSEYDADFEIVANPVLQQLIHNLKGTAELIEISIGVLLILKFPIDKKILDSDLINIIKKQCAVVKVKEE